jgi:CRP/FNR family cyclic AMP-dependent transcriptional regulator
MEAAEVRKSLAGHHLFDGFSSEELDAIAEAGNVRLFSGGEYLIREGDEGDSLYILLSGEAKVTKKGAKGEHELATIERDAMVGEIGLLLAHARSASVRSIGDGSCFQLSRGSFEGILDSDEMVQRQAGRKLFGTLARSMGERQKETNQRLIDVLEEDHPPNSPKKVDLSGLKARFGRSLTYHL